MKNIYLLLLSALFPLNLYAQPIINSSIVPEIGDTWTVTFMEANTFDPGLGGGVAQTWDFSNLDLSNTIDIEMQILDPTAITNGPSFPAADFVWYLQDFDVYNYYSVEDDSVSLVGGASISNGSVDFLTEFLDPEDGLHLPLTHGDNYTYYSRFEQSFGGTSLGINDRNGIVAVDGFGTVITPNGSYDNILRLVITETSFGFTSTQYAWYDVNNFVPVFLYEESDDPDTPPSLYFSTPDVASPTVEINNKNLDWNVWYSKGESKIHIEFPELDFGSEGNIQVYTLDGKLISSKKLDLGNRSQEIAITTASDFTTLVLTLQIDKQVSSKKIQVFR